MVNLSWLPGSQLIQRAVDATRLAGAIIDHRKRQRAVVLAEESARVAQFRGKRAAESIRELYEAGDVRGLARLFVPDSVIAAAIVAKDVWWKIWDIYWIFALLRVALVFLPQSGYIHPDEFFQTVEVVVGDVYDVDVTRTWEFNSTAPIRSMVVPTLIMGSPLYVLKIVNYFSYRFFGLSVVGPYLVLLIPRLAMLALSFSVDYCVYKICVLYKHSYNRCLTTLASSYVMLVYSTRTFTNTLEMFMATWLIYLVAHCIKRTSETVYLQSMLKEAHENAETMKEKVAATRKKKLIPDHDFKHFLPISVLVVVGTFNRPTFPAFAAAPVFFWLQRGVATNSYFSPFQIFNFRVASLLPGFLVTFLSFLLFDSLYYGHLTLHKLWHLTMDWADWKCTPVNFVMYNVVPGNLDKHGTHPFYLHALVNLPILFGPMAVLALLTAGNFFFEMISNEWRAKPNVRNVYALTMFSFVTGLCALSLFPHQEPRFLIPLIVPIVLMNAHKLRYDFMGRRPLLTLWYAFNILATVFYGFCHQGGVYGAVNAVSRLEMSPRAAEATVVFSNTYMPPKFPLLLAAAPGDRERRREYMWKNNMRVHIQDMAGNPLAEVSDRLLKLASRARYLKDVKVTETYLVIPMHLIDRLQTESKDLHIQLVRSVFPHVGLDSDLPIGADWLAEALSGEYGIASLPMEFMRRFTYFGLGIYRVEMSSKG